MSQDNPSTSSNGPLWFNRMLSGEGMVADVVKNSQAAFEDSYRIWSDEFLRFVNRRLEHNNAAIQQYRGCKDATEFMTAQQKWLADLAQDYSEEATRMGEMARKMFAGALPTSGQPTAPQTVTPQKSEKRAQG